MTYLSFLVLFVLIPSLVLARLARPRRQEWMTIGLLVLVAYLWTTPWDNYLVASGVWSYDPRLVMGITLGWVPLEEYLFFGVMTVLAGAWVVVVTRWLEPRTRLIRWLAFSLLFLALAAVILMTRERPPSNARPWDYLWLILGWALPVIFGQIAIGGSILPSRWPVWVVGAMVPTLYLTGIDALALGAGIWEISPEHSLNLFLPGRVPIEEGVFFLVTNLMIVQGLVLALNPVLQARMRRIWSSRF